MTSLPIAAIKDQFLGLLPHNHLVVEAQTGSGKSTCLPLWAAQQGRVLVVEPRRIACTALAEFVGRNRDDVGYAIRYDNSVTDASRIAFVTPGVALRWFSEGQLSEFTTVIIDEFHERRWDTDLLLALLKQHAKHQLVLTSATVDGDRLARYLGGQRLQAQGRNYQVEIKHIAANSDSLPSDRDLVKRVSQAVAQALTLSDGDLLLFLPGRKEIQQVQANLCRDLPHCDVIALHSSVAKAEQQRALAIGDKRRIVVATNVAETSLTIPGVTVVIDSGLERRTNQRNGRTVLSLTRISKASAAQRAGRAGRTQAGYCLRLWGQYAPLEALTPPELQREELVEPMLAAACANNRIEELAFIDPLPPKSMQLAQQKLQQMRAIDKRGFVTEHGQRLFPLPIDTQFAHLISAMPDKASQEAMVDLAAALSVGQRLWRSPSGEQAWQALQQWQPLACDATTLIQLVRTKPPEELGIDPQIRGEARQLAAQIRSALALPELAASSYFDRAIWLTAVLAAMPELAFVRRGERGTRRRDAMGNGSAEVQPSRETRFNDDSEAALVLDQFALPGRGVKQTITLATCMAPITLTQLAEAELGEEQLAQNSADELGQRLHQRVYAGRVIATQWRQPDGDIGYQLMIEQLLSNKLMAPVGSTLMADARAWQLYLGLGLAQGEPIEPRAWLQQRLIDLGVECPEDLELLEPQDLKFDGVPEWERPEFELRYPAQLKLPELTLTVEYAPKAKRVEVIYHSGRRKDPPKRWELPSWNGWRVRYRKASRVLEVR